MDQIKTGRFIAQLRKEKGYTQKQLADILEISDKTLSKWETGRGFPEMALLLPLCQELGINVNELLSGQRLTDGDYKQKAEENISSLVRENQNSSQKPLKSLFRSCALAALLVAGIEGAVGLLCFFTAPAAVGPLVYNVLVWLVLGALAGIKAGYDARKLHTFQQQGLALPGRIQEMIPSGWVRMGNYATCRVICTYVHGGREYTAKSGYYLLPPFIRDSSLKATVYCDPEKPGKCVVGITKAP